MNKLIVKLKSEDNEFFFVGFCNKFTVILELKLQQNQVIWISFKKCKINTTNLAMTQKHLATDTKIINLTIPGELFLQPPAHNPTCPFWKQISYLQNYYHYYVLMSEWRAASSFVFFLFSVYLPSPKSSVRRITF